MENNMEILQINDILFEEPTQFIGRQIEVNHKGKKQVLTISNIILNNEPNSINEEGYNRHRLAKIEFQDSNIVMEVVTESETKLFK
jgi:hypothetical protein